MEELLKIQAAIRAGITKTELARRSGVSRRLLDSIDDPNWNPTLQTLRALALAADELVHEQISALRSAANG